MGIGSLSGSGRLPEEAARELLESGSPLVVRFDEAVAAPESAIKGFLLVDAFGTKAGTRVTVMQAEGFRGRRGALAAAISGDDRHPALVKGDVVAFSNAYAETGVARVGRITARTHDGLVGHVQVFTAMARASQSKVSKKGASQYLTVADGKAASVARGYEDVGQAFAAAKARPWPGGAAGLIFRDRGGGTGEFFEEPDSGIDHLLDELRHHGILDGPEDALELIPAWRLPMGREQVTMDVDPRQETPRPVSGPFTQQFESRSIRGQGFLPCLVIACDEDEWAFGGKTGRRVRVAHGVQPLFKREPVPVERLPSSVRTCGGTPNTVLSLYGEEELARLAAERAARRGPDPEPERSPAGERDDGNWGGQRQQAPRIALGRLPSG